MRQLFDSDLWSRLTTKERDRLRGAALRRDHASHLDIRMGYDGTNAYEVRFVGRDDCVNDVMQFGFRRESPEERDMAADLASAAVRLFQTYRLIG